VFGERSALAAEFADLLAGDGVTRGVLGPREPERIWTRHLLNCAVITELFEPGQRIVDVGSGAGLPGIAIAIRRADLRVDLIEPLQRRVDFLTDAVRLLGMERQVRVLRGRAEDAEIIAEAGCVPWVTARAVAPLDRLVRWCLPLADSTGRLALMKGASAGAELERHKAALRRLGVRRSELVRCGVGVIDPPATVVTIDASVMSRGSR
jgi:16S rRNA (guanine527-N7)-methyltransferase